MVERLGRRGEPPAGGCAGPLRDIAVGGRGGEGLSPKGAKVDVVLRQVEKRFGDAVGVTEACPSCQRVAARSPVSGGGAPN